MIHNIQDDHAFSEDTEQTFWNGTQRERVVHFPWDELDPSPPAHDPQGKDFRAAGEALGRLLAFCWRAGMAEPEVAFRKFCAVTWIVRPDLVDGLKSPELAEKLFFTKAGFSQCVRAFREEFGDVQFGRGRTKAARESMRLARMRNVNSRKPSPWRIHKQRKADQ